MATPHAINNTKRGRHKSAVRIIGLMGRYQAGKSVFINELRQQWRQPREVGKFEEGVKSGSRSTVVEKTGSPYWKTKTKGYDLVEIPGFRNQPPNDGDGAIIQEIAKFLVQVYEDQGFAGLVYLHDYSQNTPEIDIQRDMALLCAMIGPVLYDHTAVVLNKYEDEIRAQFSWPGQIIENCWRELTTGNETVVQGNKPPRGEPGPIVELIWGKPPEPFALTKELVSGTKLCETTVGKLYKRLLELDIDETERGSVRHAALKEELRKWKKCKDNYKSIVAELELRDSSTQ